MLASVLVQHCPRAVSIDHEGCACVRVRLALDQRTLASQILFSPTASYRAKCGEHGKTSNRASKGTRMFMKTTRHGYINIRHIAKLYPTKNGDGTLDVELYASLDSEVPFQVVEVTPEALIAATGATSSEIAEAKSKSD